MLVEGGTFAAYEVVHRLAVDGTAHPVGTAHVRKLADHLSDA